MEVDPPQAVCVILRVVMHIPGNTWWSGAAVVYSGGDPTRDRRCGDGDIVRMYMAQYFCPPRFDPKSEEAVNSNKLNVFR